MMMPKNSGHHAVVPAPTKEQARHVVTLMGFVSADDSMPMVLLVLPDSVPQNHPAAQC